jgi:predicted lipoprotein
MKLLAHALALVLLAVVPATAQEAPERRREIAERTHDRLRDPRMADLRAEMEALRSAREVESLQRAGADTQRSVQDGSGRYRSIGQVYRDTAAGKLFVVEE